MRTHIMFLILAYNTTKSVKKSVRDTFFLIIFYIVTVINLCILLYIPHFT